MTNNKYEKLTQDILTALTNTAHIEKDETISDGGTASNDCAGIFLPRWAESKVEEAVKKAGAYAIKSEAMSKAFGKAYYTLIVPTHNQGNRRSKRAEAITLELVRAGYDAMAFQAMD